MVDAFHHVCDQEQTVAELMRVLAPGGRLVVNAIRKDDMRPLVYRTHDFGKTWELISNGMNPMGPVNTH